MPDELFAVCTTQRVVFWIMTITRRDVLAGIGAGLGAAALGCGDDHPSQPADAHPGDASPDAAITACNATSTHSAEELLAGIESIVVLCMENRSFDHYLGALRLNGRTDIDGLRGNESNPDPGGAIVPSYPQAKYAIPDLPHDWDSCHTQWNNGANSGFVISHAGPDQVDAMGYYVKDQLAVTYALAEAGCVCNRWFSSVMGPTWPNRFHLHAARAYGEKGNNPVPGLTSIWDRCADKGISNINYYSDVPWALGAFNKTGGYALVDQFFTDAAAGTLPAFSLIDPQFFNSGANDDHPDHDVQLGQAFINTVVAALGQSPQWNKLLFVLMYDEHGGFFDHVPPPQLAPGVELEPGFDQLGFRIPAIVLGPTVRRGCAIDTQFEHVSVAATVTKRFGLVPLIDRVTAANDLSACIDPRLLDTPLPPPVLPKLVIPRGALEAVLAGPGRDTHRELADALARRPSPLDLRAHGNAVTRRMLAIGERLGAIQIV